MMSNGPIKNNLKSAEFLRAEAELLLEEARKQKAEKNKDVGEPITLPGVPIDIKIRGDYAWIAENTAVARKINLETGKTVQIYKGHSGPVTCVALCDKVPGSGDEKILITGSWDQTIKLWDTDTRKLISSTPAHSDFVKVLFVIPSLNLLISGSSDKAVRFWDLSSPTSPEKLPALGSISSHTRPVESLDAYIPTSSDSHTELSPVLFTADTMGVIKAWDLKKEGGDRPIWRSTLRDDLAYHRTRINELIYGHGNLWTDAFPYLLGASGDVIRVYDISSLEEPEFIREVEGHWHDVTHLRVWLRKRKDGLGKEVWILSASLDGTIRKWKLAELIVPPKPVAEEKKEIPVAKPPSSSSNSGWTMTEEEDRELAELMEDD
ncbi:hypothetical protein EW146_g6626 [Bondarzewia mesenterica]|uniref:Uncharacterized protein n=1 Tax=Bondarzewia mesenterica TaxID=1095465 RepID=A0A4S4LNX5_9AGAM|nr:hypothetical protein EW146_g6626 [Bondarzewia mesenterica]